MKLPVSTHTFRPPLARPDAAVFLELPADRVRPAVRTFACASVVRVIEPSLQAAAGQLAARHGVGLRAVLAAAWALLLSRLSGQRDLVVGLRTIDARTAASTGRPEVVAAMRLELPGTIGLAALLGRVDRALAEALDRDPRAGEPTGAGDVRAGPAAAPAAQAVYAFDAHDDPRAAPPAGPAPEGDDASPEALAADIALSIDHRRGALSARFDYATELYDEATIRRHAGHWLTLLGHMVSGDDRPLHDLPLLTEPERAQIVRAWNATAGAWPEERCIHEFFERRATRDPEATALIFEHQSMSYRQLELRTRRLAHHLNELGVGPETLVVVCLDRSPELVIGLLAVARAGGAYVPFDPEWPRERKRDLLAALAAPVVLTSRVELPVLEEVAWSLESVRHICCLDGDGAYTAADELAHGWRRRLEDHADRRAMGDPAADVAVPLDAAERQRYLAHLAALLDAGAGRSEAERSILEIGCALGALAFESLPRGVRYVGVDASPASRRRNELRAVREGRDHVRFELGFAHEARGCVQGPFDVVRIGDASRLCCSHRYLASVLDDALAMLKPGGRIVVNDLVDASAADARPAAEPQTPIAGRFFEAWGARRGTSVVRVERDGRIAHPELASRYDVVIAPHRPVAERAAGVGAVTIHGPRPPSPRDAAPLPARATADNMAYVIYTSGSTGKPKGVVVRHRPVTNLIRWVNDLVAPGVGDRHFFVTSPCFDLSVYDVFGTLATGAAVDIAPSRVLKDPALLAAYLSSRPVTFWNSAPIAFGQLAAASGQAAGGVARETLRTVFLSGDWVPLTLPGRIRELYPNARTVVLGGATEAAVWSNYHVAERPKPGWPSVPYGVPIRNARYYVLDDRLAPQPIGVPGDLYIGGDCLASGYHDDRSRTAEKFVPDPHSPRPGGVMYRTGDRARYHADGDLEFLGRDDSQVKVRGFRIELGEIEAKLAACAGVRDAAVVARHDGGGDRQLVACVTACEGLRLEPAELRRQLARSLPRYMVPSAFVMLEALPLTPNGKLDRAALVASSADLSPRCR